jgi:predicted nucleic acid-binding protein
MVRYLDTSAFLKLLTTEDESTAMRECFSSHDSVWSSQLLHTEALRADMRLEIDANFIEEALETVSLVLPSVATFFVAGRLLPSSLLP